MDKIKMMTKLEVLNMMAQNHDEVDNWDVGYSYDERVMQGIYVFAELMGTVPIRFEDGKMRGITINKALAHNVNQEQLERLHELNWFIDDDDNTFVCE